MSSSTAPVHTIDTQHADMVHDAQFDYYGKRLATCSSDRTIKIYNIEGEEHVLSAEIKEHMGPVWQVAWAHPKFGSVIATCSYDRQVLIWKETSPGNWTLAYAHREHQSSVNSIDFAPHEFGLMLACASSDGHVSIISQTEQGGWQTEMYPVSNMGLISVSWAPASHIGSQSNNHEIRRFVTAGCDYQVYIFRKVVSTQATSWEREHALSGHSDWVRDVAWAPPSGIPMNTIASCSEDGAVFIWNQHEPEGPWNRTELPRFSAPVWRVSWSLTGTLLAVSCGDNTVTLWKETLSGKWQQVNEVESEPVAENAQHQASNQ